MKTVISHNCRSKIDIFAAYAEDASKTTYKERQLYYAFNETGGCFNMQGINNEPIEIGLDFNYFFKTENVGKVFMQVNEYDGNNLYNGIVHSLSLIDYRWGEVFELPCAQTNVPIVGYGNALLSIDYHLIPHETPIVVSDLYRTNRVSRFNPTLANNANLLLYNNVVIDMYNSVITINEGSILGMQTGSKFVAKRGANKIIINGDIQMGNGVSFIAEGDATLEIILNNPNTTINFNNCSFRNCKLTNNASILNIANCTFFNCGYVISKNTATIENSTFWGTAINLQNSSANANKTAIIRNCNISNGNSEGVLIDRFATFTIANNDIVGGIQSAICLYNSGNGNNAVSTINNNRLHDGSTGIEVYMSSGDIINNQIYNNNGAGVKLLNISNVNLLGNPYAISCSQTQSIYDNNGPEVYVSGQGFPSIFKYNCIIDDDNTGYAEDPLLYFYYSSFRINVKDVTYNYWGNNFSPEQDLYPPSMLNHLPIWNFSYIGPNPPYFSMYSAAENNEQNGNYTEAKTQYQSIVAQYPETVFAQASMKKLLNLEEFAGNNYAGLQTYYQSLTDTTLLKLSDILANKCNEKLGNWQGAINWYENVINNPTSFEDSIFSVIDLGYAYLMMEEQGGTRAAYTGTLPEHKPVSEVKFFENRNYLLSLLPGKQNQKKKMTELPLAKEGEITGITPNPAPKNTKVSLTINNSGNVSLSITNNTGRAVKTIELGHKEKGTSNFDINISELPSGAYFYTLYINGNNCDTKKAIVAK